MGVVMITLMPMAIIATVLAAFLFFCIDPVNVFVRKYLFGQQRIWVEGASYDWQDDFYTIMQKTPTGKLKAYRFPSFRIGRITLNADGTGDYCGKIRWVLA